MAVVKEKSNKVRLNGDLRREIGRASITLITEDGMKFEGLSFDDALTKAENADLDLVLVGSGDVPVCKLMDYSKVQYEKKRNARKSEKTTTVTKWKEVKLSIKIAEHDLNVKANALKKFVSKGYKVRVIVQMRGREQSHPELGKSVLNKFVEMCGEVTVEKAMFREGNKWVIHIG